MFDIEVQEEKKEKQALLQQRYLERLAQRRKETPLVVVEVVDYQEKYEQEKKKRKNLQKKVRQHEQKMVEKTNWMNQQKKQLAEEKEKQQLLRQQLKDVYQEKQTLLSVQKHLQQTITSLEEALQNEQDKQQREKENHYRKKREDSVRQATKQQNIYQQLQSENQSLKRKLKIQQSIHHTERNAQKDREIQSLRQRNRELTHQVTCYKRAQEPSDILKILQDLITEQHVAHFFNEKQNKLEQLAKKANELKWSRKRKKTTLRSRLSILQEDDPSVRFGYITRRTDTWYFFDAQSMDQENSLIYPIVGNTTGQSFQQDIPVKVYVRDAGDVMVIGMYEDYILPETVTTHIKSKQKPKEKTNYPSFGDARILIIGSRQLHQYKQRLEKHGLSVELHNPFEESYHRIKGRVNTADIVIVCTSHISHSVIDHLNKKDPKIEFIERDNEEWIAARVRFALQQKDLLPSITTELLATETSAQG